MADPFIGEIRLFAGNFAPRYWAFCTGQLLPIAQYSALFSLLGTVYGGDGRTTFGLPDLQGRAPMHAGAGPGLTTRSLGEQGGTAQVVLSEAEMASHSHPLAMATAVGTSSDPKGRVPAASPGPAVYGAPASPVALSPAAGLAETRGGGLPHENRQPYLAVNFIIALSGVFPSRP